MLVVLFSMSANVLADGLTATLQQGDVMTPFYGVNAFKEACAAAKDGAVITLSAGKFNNVNDIDKSVRIVGNFGLNLTSTECTILSSTTISSDNVTIDGIYFTGNVTLGNIQNFKIVHSWIEGILTYSSSSSWHTNSIVDQCVIKADAAIKQGKNYTIKNSTIGKFCALNSSDNLAYISNCTIYTLYRYWTTAATPNNRFDSGYEAPFAIYKNNVIFVKDQNCGQASILSSPREFYYNLFSNIWYYPTYWNASLTLSFSSGCQNDGNTIGDYKELLKEGDLEYPSAPTTQVRGQDGTVVGPYGGTGFSEYPAIPRVISKSIDSNSNAEGKINVKITVKAEQ